MTRWLCLFSGHDYEATTQRTMDMAPALGVDRIRVYDDVWLEHHPFRRINHHLFETVEKVGYGWHAWKALIILDTMKHSADGDVVMYLDADTYPSGARLEPLYETALREDMMLFDCSGRRHRDWCKRDCFIVMGLDEPKYHESLAGCARFGLWTKGRYRAEQWLYEWLTYSINPFANTRQSGVASKYGAELEGFSIVGIGGVSEHRTEQAIYTLLAHKYGAPLYPEASAGGRGVPQYFEQAHCTKGNEQSNPGTHCRHFNVEMP